VLRLRSDVRANIGWKSAISLQRGPVDQKFQVEGVALTNHSCSQKTRLSDLSFGIKIWTDLSSILSQIARLTHRQTDRRTDGQTDRQTDGRTDRIFIARPRLHCMQRGNLNRRAFKSGNGYKNPWDLSEKVITLHRDLIQSLANARSHTLVPRRGTLFLQTCVQFQTAAVLNQNLKPIFFN